MAAVDHAPPDAPVAVGLVRPTPRSLAPHVLALAVLLAILGWVLGPGIFTIDENAYRTQVDQLVEEGTWAFPLVSPVEAVPPVYAPLALSDVTEGSWFPYARHPAYPASLTVLDPLAPGRSALLLSGLSLVVLALACGVETARLSRVDGRVGFWLAATASPFLVHSLIGWAHLPAAAAVAVAVAAIGSRQRVGAGAVALVVVGLSLAVLFRTEGLFVAAAMLVAVLASKRPQRSDLTWAAVIAGVTAAAFVVDRWLFRLVTGEITALPTGGSRTEDPFAVQRFQAAIALFFDAGGVTPQHVARLVAAVLLAMAAVMVRRNSDTGIVVMLSGAGLAAGAFGALHVDAYPSLLAAWPALAPAAIFVGGRPEHRFRMLSLGVLWAGLIAMAPADGGGRGWGARLGLVGLGLIVPVVADAMSERRPAARVVMGAALALGALVSVAGLRHVDTARETSVVVEAEVSRVLPQFADGDRPVVTTDRRLGRIAPGAAISVALQSMSDDGPLAEYLALADANGVGTVIHLDLFDHDVPDTPDGWRQSDPTIDGVVRVIRFERVDS